MCRTLELVAIYLVWISLHFDKVFLPWHSKISSTKPCFHFVVWDPWRKSCT
jgi:hypothetical protein